MQTNVGDSPVGHFTKSYYAQLKQPLLASTQTETEHLLSNLLLVILMPLKAQVVSPTEKKLNDKLKQDHLSMEHVCKLFH